MTVDEVLDYWRESEPKIRRQVELLACAGWVRCEAALMAGFDCYAISELWWDRHLLEWGRQFLGTWYGQEFCDDEEFVDRLDSAFSLAGCVFGNEASARNTLVIPVLWPDPLWFPAVVNRGYRWSDGQRRMIQVSP